MYHKKPEAPLNPGASIKDDTPQVDVFEDQKRNKSDPPGESELEEQNTHLEKLENDELLKIRNFIKEISDNNSSDIYPEIDYNTNLVTYPILQNLKGGQYDTEFLEKMTKTHAKIIEKYDYEWIMVCDEHPTNFKVSPKLLCPKCNSSNIEKFQLLEHKICGFISELNKFNARDIREVVSCPSCKKEIRNHKKELRVPGMWYKCNQCLEKINNPPIKFQCRGFNHDFDINSSRLIGIPAYKVIKTDIGKMERLSVLTDIKQILQSKGFSCVEFTTIKGKSGLEHNVELNGNNNGKEINVLIKESEKEFEDNEIKSLLLDLIDLPSEITILIAIPTISQSAKTIMSNYKITVITGDNNSQISAKFKEEIESKMTIPKNSLLG